MKILIDASCKIGNGYLYGKKVLDKTFLEYAFLASKELKAAEVLILIPEEAKNDASDILRKYKDEYSFVTAQEARKAEVILAVNTVYNLSTIASNFKKFKGCERSILWKINGERDISSAQEELRRSFWFPIGRYYIVSISRFLAEKVFKKTATPNQVTLLSFLFGLSSAAMLLGNYFPFYPISALCYLIFWILDITDGKLARLQNRVSSFGAWFDPVIGEAMDYIMHLFIVLSLYLKGHNVIVIWWGVFYFIGKHLTIYAMQLGKDRFEAGQEARRGISKNKGASCITGAAHFFHDADFRVHFLALAILLNAAIVPLIAYALYFNAWFITKVALEYSTYKKERG